MNFKFETFANARAQKGIQVRWVKLDRFRRVQEWFIPWTAIGQRGDISAEPAAGMRLAFAPSYTDRDKGGEDPGTPKNLGLDQSRQPLEFLCQPRRTAQGLGRHRDRSHAGLRARASIATEGQCTSEQKRGKGSFRNLLDSAPQGESNRRYQAPGAP